MNDIASVVSMASSPLKTKHWFLFEKSQIGRLYTHVNKTVRIFLFLFSFDNLRTFGRIVFLFGMLRPRPGSSEPSRTENKHNVMYVLTKSANYPTVRDMMDRSGGRNIEPSSHIYDLNRAPTSFFLLKSQFSGSIFDSVG